MRIFLLAAIVASLALPAAAQQFLYKWTDAQGRIQYSDHPPKDFKGTVQRIEVDPPGPAPSVPSRAPAPAAGAKPQEPKAVPAAPVQDMATQRRTLREKLQADIDAAQARLDAAKKELAGAAQPGDDERQVIQQYPANLPGSLPASGRSNCMTVTGADGKKAVRCAAVIPNGAYYERVQALEQKVKEAEDALADAQSAYRRGVD
jgi:hypothetical protein